MTEVSFTIAGEPVSKARARFTNYGSKTRAYTPQKTLNAEQAVAWSFKAAGGRLEPDAEVTFGVEVTFHNGTRQRRDVDNMIKLILDGLNGVAWVDDTQVMEVIGRKRFTTRADARTDVRVYTVGTIDRLTKPCVGCGKDFVTYESVKDRIQHCSASCRRATQKAARQRKCEQCGTQFLAHGKTHGTQFCSRACLSASGRTRVNCTVCGTEFETVRSWAAVRNFCSDPCRRKRDAEVHRERRTTTFPGTCLICGAGTTRKEYARCNPCKLAGKKVPA